MSGYKTKPGLMVAREIGGVRTEVNVHEDGSVHAKIGKQPLDLTEAQAGELHELMDMVLEYHVSSD